MQQPIVVNSHTLSNNQWLVHAKPRPDAQIRLFCLPFAGGGASTFLPWMDKLASEIEILPVQLPGRENQFTVPAFRRLNALLEMLGEVLTPYIDVPYALFGHSMGGLICFELVRYLRRMGLPLPQHLFVSGSRAPHIFWQVENPPIHQLSDDRFIERIRTLNGTPEMILKNRELLQLLLPTLRADFELCETYKYQAEQPLDCAVSAFGGLRDKQASAADITAWGAQTTQAFHRRMFPGDHFFIHQFQHVLLRAIEYDLLCR